MAVILWAYVLGELDPVKSVTYRDITVNFINEEKLEEKGLTVTDVSTRSLSLTFSGKRSKVNKIKKSDFQVSINLLNVTEGDNLLDIKISHPKEVNIEDSSAETVSLTVEKVISVDKDISIELINLVSDDDEPHIVQVSKKSVEISGAESNVDKVNKVVAKLDSSRVDTKLKSLSVKLMPVDKKGKLVEGVELSFDNVSVSAIIHKKKTVELIVPVFGQEDGTIIRSVSVPKTVTIKGSLERLDSISSVNTAPLIVSDYFESTKVKLEPILPEGVELASNSAELTAEITVINAGKKDFYFDESDVRISGVSEEYKVDIKERNFVLSVQGTSDVINSLTEADFELSASAEGLDAGVHELKLEVEIGASGIDQIKILPETITIEIE